MMPFEEFCKHLEATGYQVRIYGVGFETKAEKIFEACRKESVARIDLFEGDEYRGWLLATAYADSEDWDLGHDLGDELANLIHPPSDDSDKT